MQKEIVKTINKWFKKKLIKNGKLIHLNDDVFNLEELRKSIPLTKERKIIGPFHLFKLTNLDLIDAGFIIFNDESLSLSVIYAIKGKQNTFYVLETLTEKSAETNFLENAFSKYIDLQDDFTPEINDSLFILELMDYLFANSSRLDSKIYIAILASIQEMQGFEKTNFENLEESMDLSININENNLTYFDLESYILWDYFITYDINVFDYHIPSLLRIIEAKLDTLPIDYFPDEEPEEDLPDFEDFIN